MKRKRQIPFLVKFAIITMITVVVWVAFDVYRAFTSKPNPVVSEIILKPINPILNKNLLDKMKQRVYLE